MEFLAGLVAPLTTPAGWAEVAILMFLEMALGIDNLVFIAITTDRLPEEKQHFGRKLGLAAAMVSRCILICCVVWIISINNTLFTLPFGIGRAETPINVRGLVFLLGGVYLIYKGITELKETFLDVSEQDSEDEQVKRRGTISLPRAVGIIMVMDVVFSLDSVITAAGLSGKLLVMIIAVIGAVSIMIVFADPISNFINRNPEIKILALSFITLVGVELLLQSMLVETIAGAPLSTILYAMMLFGFGVSLLIMLQRQMREHSTWRKAREAVAAAVKETGQGEDGVVDVSRATEAVQASVDVVFDMTDKAIDGKKAGKRA